MLQLCKIYYILEHNPTTFILRPQVFKYPNLYKNKIILYFVNKRHKWILVFSLSVYSYAYIIIFYKITQNEKQPGSH